MRSLRRLTGRLFPTLLRRSIGARVLAGFGLTAALALAVAVVSLIYNRDAGRSLARVTERDRELAADFRELLIAVEQQTAAVQSFLLSGLDGDLDALQTAQDRFHAALTGLEQGLPPAERQDNFEQIRARARALEDLAGQDIALYRQGWRASAHFLWRTEGEQAKQELLQAIQHQIERHNAAVDREIGRSQDHLRFAFAASLGLVALAAVTALLIGAGITRAVTGPVRALAQAAATVRGGDYSVRAPVSGEDELATLSATFNEMVQSLAASRAELERTLAEAERSEERYRLLTEKANDIIFIIDRQNRITFINPAVKAILGYEPAELIGRPVDVLYTEKTRRRMVTEGSWVAREPRTFTGDVEAIAKDGRHVTLEVNSSVMMINGHAVGIHGIARDMTERYRMEQELRRLHIQDRRRVDQLITLNEIGRRIAALQPLDTLFPQLAARIGRTFNYDHVRILLRAADGSLTVAAAWQRAGDGPPPRAAVTSPLVLRALEGDAGFVAGSGRPEDDAAARYTEIAVPVRTKDAVLGVLDVRGGVEGTMDESDIFTLQILADQVAVAIENARLYEAGQRLAVSEERNRLARDLHDSVTQELFSMTMIAGALPVLLERNPAVARERLHRLHDLARGALAEMRALLFALRPAALEDEGLVSAIQKHAAAFQHREGVAVQLHVEVEDRLPHAVEEALYRVVQEALNNVAKHARATAVTIALAVQDGQVCLSVTDNGTGFAPAAGGAEATTLGLRGMRERVELLHGSFAVRSAPGEGTTVHASIPLPAEVSTSN